MTPLKWERDYASAESYFPVFGYVQTISVAIIIAMLLHASSHLACDFPRILTSTDADYKNHLVHYFGVSRPTYFDLVKGPVGITGFIMVTFMLIAFTLASRRCRRNLTKLPKPFDKLTGFNAFWYSHHLLITVYILLIIHGVSLYLEQKWYRKTVNSIKLFAIILLFAFLNNQWYDNKQMLLSAGMDVSCCAGFTLCWGKDPQILSFQALHRRNLQGEVSFLNRVTWINHLYTNSNDLVSGCNLPWKRYCATHV